MPPNISRQISDEIYFLSGGHPKCAKSLLFAVADRGFAMPTRQDWINLFSTTVHPLIQREMLDSIRDLDLLSAFWVLSVFRRFDRDILIALLERGILTCTSGGQNYAREASRLRTRLVGTYLVNGSFTRGEGQYYRMNPMIQRVLSLSMQYHSPERYQTLNSIALEIFTERLQVTSKSPERSIVSLIEIVYHWFEALQMDPTVDESQICKRVQEALKQVLPLLLVTSEEDELLNLLPWFLGIWPRDEELKETARRATGGTKCFDELSRQVEKFVGERIQQQL
jgi:hypothetical protein